MAPPLRTRIHTPGELDASAARLLPRVDLPDLDVHHFVAGSIHSSDFHIFTYADHRLVSHRAKRALRLQRQMTSIYFLGASASAPHFLGAGIDYLLSRHVSTPRFE